MSSSNSPIPPRPTSPHYQSYTDPMGELDNKQLRYSFWYLRHRELLERLLWGFVIGVAAILWGYSLWQWGNFVIFGIGIESRLSQDLTQFPNYNPAHAHLAPQPLKVVSTWVVASGSDRYDAVAEIVNPNDRWSVKFNYYFVTTDGQTAKRSDFLLPGEDRLVAEIGSSRVANGNTSLRLENIAWSKLSPHTFPHPKEWQADHLRFEVSNFVFNLAGSSSTAALAHSVTFDFTNQTAYNYAETHFYVGLYDQGNLVGVLPLVLTSFDSLATKHLDLRIFVPLINVSEVKVFPLLDVYDPRSYQSTPRG